jgi:hypothetical protein
MGGLIDPMKMESAFADLSTAGIDFIINLNGN